MRESWKFKKLGDFCEVLNGFAFKSDKYTNAGTRVIRITNVQKGYIVDDDPKYYPDCEMANIEQYRLFENDLLMSLTGNVGRVGLLQKELLPAALNQRVACLRIKGKNISLRYLFHCLNSEIFEQKAIFSASGIAQKNMSTEWLKKYEIPVPSYTEQERIVAELDCLSDIIEKQKQQLKELDNLAQSIFYTTFGDPKSDNFGWGLDTIGNLCTLKSGDSGANNTSEGDLPYVKVGDMNIEANNPYITTSSTFVSREENKKRILPVGTTIFPKRGGAIYTNKKRLTAVEICCDLNTMGVIPKENVLPQFIYHYFLHLDFGELCNGATIPQINNIDIAPLVICTPPLSVQQEFASKVEAIEKQKDMIKQSIEETETLFNSRMDYYFN